MENSTIDIEDEKSGKGKKDGPGPAPHGPKGAPAKGPKPGPKGPKGGPGLLLSPGVREELGLTDEQIAQIEAIAPAPKPKDPEASTASQDDASEEAEEEHDASAQGPKERIQAILTPEQHARYEQIGLQREGARAILRPDVAKKLGLNEERLATLRPVPPHKDTPPKPAHEGERPDPRKDDERILASLTESQRSEWDAMLGRPFEGGGEKARPVLPSADGSAQA